MEALSRNYQVSFKTNSDLYRQAKEIFSQKNMNLTEVMNEFLKTVVDKKEIPFETAEDRKKAAILAELQSEIEKSFESYQAGDYVSQAQMKERYGL